MATSPVEELVDLPAAVWGSQGVARWMQWAATPDLLEGIRWLTALLCCVVCVGFVRKLVAVPLLGGVLLVEWLKRDCSYGNHAELALIYAALIVLWGEATQRGGATEDQRHRNHRQVLLVTCLGYSLIGARRLASGGLEWVWSGGLVEVMATRAAENRGWNFDGGLVVSGCGEDAATAIAVGATLMTIGEFLSPLALIGKVPRRAFYGFALSLHAGVAWMMDIYFWENVVLILGLAVSEPRTADVRGVPGRNEPR